MYVQQQFKHDTVAAEGPLSMCVYVFVRLLDGRFEPYRVGKSREARPKIVSLRTDSRVRLTEQQLNRGVGCRCLTKRVPVLSSNIVVAIVIARCYSCSNGFRATKNIKINR